MKLPNRLIQNAFILFTAGIMFYKFFQWHSSPFYRHQERSQYLFFTKWLLPLMCGLGSALVGLIYPCLKYKCHDQEMRCQNWSHALRCITMFFGLIQACSKVDFPSNLQLSLSLAVISVGMWWYFDRTTIGFGIGVFAAVLATLAIQILVYHRICIYSEREFLYVKSWLPCVVFSGGITVANIGKQLAANDFSDIDKSHAE